MTNRWKIAGAAFAALVVAGAAVSLVRDDTRTTRFSTVADEIGGDTGGDEARAFDPGVGTAEDVESGADDALSNQDLRGGGAGSGAPGVPVPPGEPGRTPEGEPRIIRRASMQVEVAPGAVADAFEDVAAIVERLGGFVEASETFVATDDEAARESGTLTVRVPVDRFEDARRSIGDLGTVVHESIQGQDVSGQIVDLDARIRSLEAQEEALRTLLGEARNVGEVLQVQDQLFSVRTEIEQLGAQKANLEDAADLATLQVDLVEEGDDVSLASGSDERTTLAEAWDDAVGVTLDVVGGMVVAAAFVLPLLTVVLVLWVGSTPWRRRRRSADPSESAEGEPAEAAPAGR